MPGRSAAWSAAGNDLCLAVEELSRVCAGVAVTYAGCSLGAIPIILFGREYWQRVIDLQFMADEGTIADEDIELLDFVETAAQAWAIIQRGLYNKS